ncbi:hypothetical protein [Streptomyces flavidovirens]|uniref:hypothetical protein n=1 Tax=Streptomyces flavidovirens TaxID=67298 RepID=UPI0003FB5970|nr:hypothetical protein [Streptomyces flavidovirens]
MAFRVVEVSIAVTFPCAIVNDMTESARPSEVATTPTVPLTSAGCAYCAKRAEAMACPATVGAPWRTRLPSAPPSDRATHIRVEHRDQRIEAAAACRREEGVHDHGAGR